MTDFSSSPTRETDPLGKPRFKGMYDWLQISILTKLSLVGVSVSCCCVINNHKILVAYSKKDLFLMCLQIAWRSADLPCVWLGGSTSSNRYSWASYRLGSGLLHICLFWCPGWRTNSDPREAILMTVQSEERGSPKTWPHFKLLLVLYLPIFNG